MNISVTGAKIIVGTTLVNYLENKQKGINKTRVDNLMLK